MPRKSQPIRCINFVQQADGSYKSYEDLTPEEKSEFSQKIVNRIGKTFNDYFSLHPEEYAKL